MKLNHILLKNAENLHELSPEEIKKLHKILLEIYTDIASACEKNNLEVFLSGGTCLGAVRHAGFIPWDDDMDLNMFREDFDKLPDAMNKEFPNKYIIAGPGTSAISRFTCLRVEKIGTHIQTVWDGENGGNSIGIDIFPVDSVPQNKIHNLIHGIRLNFCMYMRTCTRLWQVNTLGAQSVMKASVLGKIKIRIRRFIGFIFSWRKWYLWSERFNRIASKRYKSDFVTIAAGRNHYFGEIQKRSIFYPFKKGAFEGIEVNLPNDTDTYLKSLYGDYMQIPPVEKREKHFVVKIDFGE